MIAAMSLRTLAIRTAAAVLPAILASCGGAEAGRAIDASLRPEAEQPDAAIEFRFGWPVGARAEVLERIRGAELAFSVRYVLSVASSDSGGFVIRTDGLDLVEVGGQRADREVVGDRFAGMISSLQSAMPSLLVGASGDFLGVEDADAWVERSAMAIEAQIASAGEDLGERADIEAALRARAAMMRAPEQRDDLIRAAGDRYAVWVGSWLGLAARPGETVQRPVFTTLPWSPLGSELELPVQMGGYIVEPADHVRVEIRGAVEPAADELPADVPEQVRASLRGVRGLVERVAVLDPTRLLPLHVEARFRMERPSPDGGDPQSVEELRSWDFTWQLPGSAEGSAGTGR
jgi:hypothetical protein